MTDFGLHVLAAGTVDVYRNGNQEGRYAHTSYSGGYLLMSAHGNALPHVNRIEVRTAPGGTLLFSDDFVDLSAWSLGSNGGFWTISPAGFAFGSSIVTAGYGVYVAQPAGGDFVELQGVTFDGNGSPDGWVMVTPYRVNPATPADGPTNIDGYRILLRPNGSLELVNGALAPPGWSVGQVRIA